MWPNYSIPKYLPKKHEIIIYTKTYTQIFLEALFLIAKTGNPEVHIYEPKSSYLWTQRFIDKQMVVYLYTRMLHSNQKVWTTDT